MSGLITRSNRPWEHTVIDDFLDADDLVRFQQECIQYNEKVVLPAMKTNGNTKGHYRYKYQYDPLLAYNLMKYFHEFTIKRPYEKLEPLVQLVKTCNGAEYPIHEDAPHKVFSFVLYLSPEENIGTNLYYSDESFARKIEWKPNRAVMFCPLDEITYHDYGSSTDRYTLMYNLISK